MGALRHSLAMVQLEGLGKRYVGKADSERASFKKLDQK
jgi:hypothetical protein